MNILVIGGAGFVGCNLVRYCLEDLDNCVTVLDSLEPRLKASTDNLRSVWDGVRFVRGSMCDEPLIAEMVQGQDVIFNCAGQTSHPLSLHDPLFDAEINCLGNLKLLEAVRLLNPKATVVYTSSSTVIGKAQLCVVDETHSRMPLDIYSADKGVAEDYYMIYNRVHDLNTVVIRFPNLYGPYGKGNPDFGFVNHFIHTARQGQEIKVFGEGSQTRNLLYVEDAVKVLYCAAFDKRLTGKVFFATGDEHRSVLDIAQTIVRIFESGSVAHVPWPDERKRIEIDDVRISSKRLRSITGWKPHYSFEEGLEKTKAILGGNDETVRNGSAGTYRFGFHPSHPTG